MKRIYSYVFAMFFIAEMAQAQIDFQFLRADNSEEVSLKSLIRNADGTNKRTFVVTWGGEWCYPCQQVIASLDKAAKSGLVQLLAVNVDDAEDWPSVKAEGIHNNWKNTTTLYADPDISNSFATYFNTNRGPVVLYFNEDGNIQYMDASASLRSHHFVDYFGKEFIWEDSDGLNEYAWNYYLEHSIEDKIIATTDADMAKALEFVRRSIELSPEYNNTDTLAALLFLTGEYKEALKTAKEAIDIAKANEEDYETTNELIQKIIEKM